MIFIFFIEQSWTKDGLGVSNKNVSIWTLISYAPSVIILMGSPKIVPKYISYSVFIRTACILLSLVLIATPFIRDMFTEATFMNNVWVVYVNIILVCCFNPKLFSPFINFLINSEVHQDKRTAANSITFIGSTLCSSILINIVSVLYADSFTKPFFTRFAPYNKYASFLLLFLLLIIGSSFLKKARKIIPETV